MTSDGCARKVDPGWLTQRQTDRITARYNYTPEKMPRIQNTRRILYSTPDALQM